MDSDDEGDYKRGRDKFRSERRSGYGGFEGGGGSSPPHHQSRREWRNSGQGYGSRGRYEGSSYSSNYSARRERMSPSSSYQRRMSPPSGIPHKRMRGEWDDRYEERYHRGGHRGGGDDYERGGGGFPRGGGGGGVHGHHGHHGPSDDGMQPAMMSFKAFLTTQDDSISDEDAIKKYSEYKLEFKRQQLNEFFVNHKDEEWFKLKYHPEESAKRKEDLKAALSKRIEVFKQFKQMKLLDKLSADADNSENLLKFLDSVTLFLEGGSEEDLKLLEKEYEEKLKQEKEELSKSNEPKKDAENNEEKEKRDEKEENGQKEEEEKEENKMQVSEEQLELQKKAKEYLESKSGEKEEANNEDKRGKKRKRTKDYDNDENSESDSSDEDNEELPPGMEKDKEKQKDKETESETKEEEKSSKEEEEENNGEEDGEQSEKRNEDENKKGDEDENEEKAKAKAKVKVVVEGKKEEEDRLELHRTSSIFLRNLAPTITKQEVEAMCKRYAGFLRASISDPQPDRKWFRRGWVTFKRNVKIKDICFQLNNIRLRECELGAIVNRDLTRRVRTVNGVTVDKKVVRNDIKLAAKVVTNLDKKWNLWQKHKDEKLDDNNSSENKEENNENENNDIEKPFEIGLGSDNPVLDNITDYLIEEASAEEEELLGRNNDLEDGEEGEEGNLISRDNELVKVLDRMIFYLRIVHSVDFYSHSEYPNEHEMPNRCGILHVRASAPTGKVTQNEIDDYCAIFERKMGSFLQPRASLKQEDASKLGMKNEEDEVEKFVQANTQELAKDKWLCPLSGKKFKGPDFVRKHIFNKHAEKVDEVKKEVQYYNNYLQDPKRPQLPENPMNRSASGNFHGRSRPDFQHHHHPRGGGHRDPYHYSGHPREATSYPVYDDYRTGNARGGFDRHERGGYHKGYSPRGRGGHDYGRGSGRMPRGGYQQGVVRYGGAPGGRAMNSYRDLDAPKDIDEF